MKGWWLILILILLAACDPDYSYEQVQPEENIQKIIEFKNLEQYCSDLGGNFCERNEYCSANALTERCCSSGCSPAKMNPILDKPSELMTSCFISKNGCSDGDCKILIIVDEEVNKELDKELTVWKQDIINDLNMQVEFLVYPLNVVPYQIKSDIMKRLSQEKIKGFILVGDIPTTYYGEGYQEEVYPSDFYYEDFEGLCSDEYSSANGQKMYEINQYYYKSKNKECKLASQIFFKPLWRGRISPGSDKINNLRNYFERNHAYRTGQLNYNKELLGFYPIIEKAYDKDITNFVDLKIDELYNKSKVKLIPLITEKQKEDKPGVSSRLFLEELKKPYESVYYNGHGSPNFQQENIKSSDVEDAKPNALFYSFSSCSVGRFSVKDYLVGKYLFSGNSLIAFAPTTPIFGATGNINRKEIQALKSGLTFGEIFNLLYQGKAEHLFGDPTLVLRKQESNAKACIDSLSIDFGKIKPGEIAEKHVKVENLGTEELSLEMDQKEFITIPDISLFIKNYKCNGKIKPKESMNCFFRASAQTPGIYEGIINLITSDPNNKLIQIRYGGVQE